MDSKDIGRLLAEMSLARAEARAARENTEKFAKETASELSELRRNDIDIQLRLREMETIKKIGWGIISLFAGVFGYLVFTTITNNNQIESIQQEIRGHVSAAGHPQSMQTINDVKNELGAINAALQEWKSEKDKDIEELKERLPRSRRSRR